MVTAGTPHARECRSFEGTPEREFALGGKPGAQEAAQARRCLFMGGGAGEPDPVAAAVRLQCAVRGVSARHVVGRELLVRRQAESRERLAGHVRLRSRLRWERSGGRPSVVQDVLGKGGVTDSFGE